LERSRDGNAVRGEIELLLRAKTVELHTADGLTLVR
jgi:hypothetical protein